MVHIVQVPAHNIINVLVSSSYVSFIVVSNEKLLCVVTKISICTKIHLYLFNTVTDMWQRLVSNFPIISAVF